MGSTSEAYENGTNVVVYVANEHARLQSQQHQHHLQASSQQLQLQPSAHFQLQPPAQLHFQPQQYHRYHGSPQIVTTSAHSSDDSEPPSPSVYKAHPYAGAAPPSSSVNVTAPVVNYEVAGATKDGAFFDLGGHGDAQQSASHRLSGCSINGVAPNYGADGGGGAITGDSGSNSGVAFAYHPSSAINGQPAVGAAAPPPATLYVNDKLAEASVNAQNLGASAPQGAVPISGVAAAPPTEVAASFAPPRSESARSVDSVNSVSSSLSCSSSNAPTPSPTAVATSGGKHFSVENFAVANNPSGCATDGATAAGFANAAKQSAAFSSSAAPYRLVSVPFKEINGNNAAAAAAAATAAAFQKPAVSVPLGWKRILNNGSVIYIRLVTFFTRLFVYP
ncbi:hypothetical protein V9T40_005272 [Parthenolecanium corni]|uniref:Uncharacterized protein n=1 Tax=Parthenolecanium corni TaxID=536013 RepID=A0AAN9THL1_9HEMI